jgi:hypothetical protein
MELTISKYQTKDWRMSQPWYKGGKHSECEKHQKSQIETITKKQLEKKQGIRINTQTGEIKCISNNIFSKQPNKLDFTEDFDYRQVLTKKDGKTVKIYYNLKFVCDSGGAQTRTIVHVHNFLRAQIKLISLRKYKEAFFVNILDGDYCYKNRKFIVNPLMETDENCREHIFCGDTHEFQAWWSRKFAI